MTETKEELIREVIKMKERIEDILNQLGVNSEDSKEGIEGYLKQLGIFPDKIGYTYLKMAIEICMKKSGIMICKDVYPEIAKQYNTSPACVEKNIRTAIKSGMSHGDKQIFDEIFGNSERLTNTKFITTLAEYFSSNRGGQDEKRRIN